MACSRYAVKRNPVEVVVGICHATATTKKVIRSEKAWDRESPLNIAYFKPFHDEDGVLFGDGRRGKGHGFRLLASGEARDHLSSQVGSLTVGKLVFRSRFAQCGGSQKNWYRRNWTLHRAYGILHSENRKVSLILCVAVLCNEKLHSGFYVLCLLDWMSTTIEDGFAMKNTAILELRKRRKNVLMMGLEYTRTIPTGFMDVAHRCVISRDGARAVSQLVVEHQYRRSMWWNVIAWADCLLTCGISGHYSVTCSSLVLFFFSINYYSRCWHTCGEPFWTLNKFMVGSRLG